MSAEFSFVPPTYPIVKQEYFDEENLKYLLVDENFNKTDRMKLSNYNKHRVSGSKINVSYKFGKNCDELKIGRLYPDDAIGLQSFRSDFRNPLAKKFYWDIDIENAHYTIALQKCKAFGIKCDAIEKYVNDRENTLKKIANSRKKAKTELLKTAYLGNIKLYNENYDDNIEGCLTEEGSILIKDLSKEFENLATLLWDKNKDLHKFKGGADNKPICKRNNPKASLMSLIFQTEERKILEVLDAFMVFKNRYMSVLIHDGGYILKLDGETCFPEELLKDGIEAIKKFTGYKVNLVVKDIDYAWTPSVKQFSPYSTMKKDFEKKNFLLGSKIVHILDDGEYQYYTIREAKDIFRTLNYEEYDFERNKKVKKYFIDEWLEDPERRFYDKMGFYPDINKCPKSIYNLFQGFKAEQYKPENALTKEEIDELVKPILKQLQFLCNDNIEYTNKTLKWLAHIIQYPDIKTEVSLLFRDEGDMLNEGGGTGKNLFLEFFGFEILGDEYCSVVGANQELYGNFNSQFEGKLFIFVEEACGKDNHSNNDILKSRITSKKLNVNKKMVANYTINDFANYVFGSNNHNPLPIRNGDRRFWVFDVVPEMRGNVEYFTNLVNHINKDIVKWAFYQYLKEYKCYKTPIEFASNMPLTNAYKEIRKLNATLYLKWLTWKF
jgi:hypothetical protein